MVFLLKYVYNIVVLPQDREHLANRSFLIPTLPLMFTLLIVFICFQYQALCSTQRSVTVTRFRMYRNCLPLVYFCPQREGFECKIHVQSAQQSYYIHQFRLLLFLSFEFLFLSLAYCLTLSTTICFHSFTSVLLVAAYYCQSTFVFFSETS